MRQKGICDFLKREWKVTVAITLIIGTFSVIIVGGSRGWDFPPPSYSDIADFAVAIVATTSLYIAWRELVRKTEPNVTIDFEIEESKIRGVQEKLTLKLINPGANIITPVNVWFRCAQKTDSGYRFSNREHRAFPEDGLNPGNHAEVELGKDLIAIDLDNINIRDWKGKANSLTKFKIDAPVRTSVVESNSDVDVKMQKLFDKLANIDHGYTIEIPKKEFQEEDIDKIIENNF